MLSLMCIYGGRGIHYVGSTSFSMESPELFEIITFFSISQKLFLLFLPIFFFSLLSYLQPVGSDRYDLWLCCDADKRKTQGIQKGLIEKHIYSSNRKKIQVNLVKQLVDRKLRVLWGSDYQPTTQTVLHLIMSRWLVNSVWRSRWRVFIEESESIM